MKRLMNAAFALFVVIIFLLSGTASANTLSDAYYQAFVTPHEFDVNLYVNVVNESDYYNKFKNCSQLAIGILNGMENQERQNHLTCPDNATCTQIAKNIQSIMDVRLNVRNLEAFVLARETNDQLNFLDSEIGRAALLVYNYHQKLQLDIRQNPVFVMAGGILSVVPCQ